MQLTAIIEKDKHGYFAYVPELKGCVSQGTSYEDVLENIKEATELYLESLSAEELEEIEPKSYLIAPLEVHPGHV